MKIREHLRDNYNKVLDIKFAKIVSFLEFN